MSEITGKYSLFCNSFLNRTLSSFCMAGSSNIPIITTSDSSELLQNINDLKDDILYNLTLTNNALYVYIVDGQLS